MVPDVLAISEKQQFRRLPDEKPTNWRRILVRLRDNEGGREDKPDGRFLHRNRLTPTTAPLVTMAEVAWQLFLIDALLPAGADQPDVGKVETGAACVNC